MRRGGADSGARLDRVPAAPWLPPSACSLNRGGRWRGAPDCPYGLAEELPRVWHARYYDAYAHFYERPDYAFERIIYELGYSVSPFCRGRECLLVMFWDVAYMDKL